MPAAQCIVEVVHQEVTVDIDLLNDDFNASKNVEVVLLNDDRFLANDSPLPDFVDCTIDIETPLEEIVKASKENQECMRCCNGVSNLPVEELQLIGQDRWFKEAEHRSQQCWVKEFRSRITLFESGEDALLLEEVSG